MNGERALPAQASLRYLKVEAKRRHAAGEFPSLHLAQLTIAREHGQPSWTALKEAVDAAGSTASRQEQAQSLLLPLGLPVIFGYLMATAAITSRNPSTFFHVLAYLPPTAPFAMPVLVSLGAASWWQVALSAGVSVACTAGVARAAVAVYRTSILRTGRRVPLRELLAR